MECNYISKSAVHWLLVWSSLDLL